MFRIRIKLVLLILGILIICLFGNGHSQQLPIQLTATEKKEMKQLAKKLWQKGYYSQLVSANLNLVTNEDNNSAPKYSSRGGTIKADLVIDNLDFTVRSIWPAQYGGKINWPFLEKNFYKSFFSVATDITGLNQIIKQNYPEISLPKIKKGSVVYLVVYDPESNANLLAIWGKINTDAKKDKNTAFYNPDFCAGKICLAVDSAMWANRLAGKKVLVQFFLRGQVPPEALNLAKLNQGTIERPIDSISIDY